MKEAKTFCRMGVARLMYDNRRLPPGHSLSRCLRTNLYSLFTTTRPFHLLISRRTAGIGEISCSIPVGHAPRDGDQRTDCANIWPRART